MSNAARAERHLIELSGVDEVFFGEIFAPDDGVLGEDQALDLHRTTKQHRTVDDQTDVSAVR